jgi:hypothetical protein
VFSYLEKYQDFLYNVCYINSCEANSASMASIIFATMMTSLKFINENKRVPNSYEKKKLVWYSFAATWIVSLVLVVLLLGISEDMKEVIGVFLSVIELLILYFGYGLLANKQYKGLVEKGKI